MAMPRTDVYQSYSEDGLNGHLQQLVSTMNEEDLESKFQVEALRKKLEVSIDRPRTSLTVISLASMRPRYLTCLRLTGKGQAGGRRHQGKPQAGVHLRHGLGGLHRAHSHGDADALKLLCRSAGQKEGAAKVAGAMKHRSPRRVPRNCWAFVFTQFRPSSPKREERRPSLSQQRALPWSHKKCTTGSSLSSSST